LVRAKVHQTFAQIAFDRRGAQRISEGKDDERDSEAEPSIQSRGAGAARVDAGNANKRTDLGTIVPGAAR
jgi:hypothetical protein